MPLTTCRSGQPISPPRAPPLLAFPLSLILLMSFGSGHVHAAPSARDLAYEHAVQAQEAGDHALAAAGYARAYHLTPPSETGPRLLFLRASVAAHLRVPADAPSAHMHLCQARELLRVHLRDAPDALTDERDQLVELEERSAATDDPTCTILAPPAPAPQPVPRDQPTPRSEPLPPPPPIAPTTPRRPLRIAGALALGISAVSFSLIPAGRVLAARASERGRNACWHAQEGCDLTSPELIDIVADGRRADTLIRLGASLGALMALGGLTLLLVSKRLARRPPRLTPGPTFLLRF